MLLFMESTDFEVWFHFTNVVQLDIESNDDSLMCNYSLLWGVNTGASLMTSRDSSQKMKILPSHSSNLLRNFCFHTKTVIRVLCCVV